MSKKIDSKKPLSKKARKTNNTATSVAITTEAKMPKFVWTKKTITTAQGTTREVVLSNREYHKLEKNKKMVEIMHEIWRILCSKDNNSINSSNFDSFFREKCREAGYTEGEIQEFITRFHYCPCNTCNCRRWRERKREKASRAIMEAFTEAEAL